MALMPNVEARKANTYVAATALFESLTEHGPELTEPATVNAVAVILQCAGYPATAQAVLEAAADRDPEAWAIYSATVVAELLRQRDEDNTQEAEL